MLLIDLRFSCYHKKTVKKLYLVTSHTVFYHLQVQMKGEDITFALKVIKKKHIVDNRQQEHIHSERKILAEARSPFVVKSVLLLRPQIKKSIFYPTQ